MKSAEQPAKVSGKKVRRKLSKSSISDLMVSKTYSDTLYRVIERDEISEESALSLFLSTERGVRVKIRAPNGEYIGHWLKLSEDDNTLILVAPSGKIGIQIPIQKLSLTSIDSEGSRWYASKGTRFYCAILTANNNKHL